MSLEKKSSQKEVQPNVESGIISSVRLDPFGNALVPTPTDDPLDPLNWSKPRKWTCIFIVCFFYFMFTYQTTAPIPSFSLLQDQFDATYTSINWTFAVPSLGLAIGPLFWSALADIYGRRIIMVIGTIIALIASGCTSIQSISLTGYMVARFFQGFGASPAATVGLSIIKDISWEHERGFRVGLWVMAIDLGALFGGLIGGFLATISQYWIAYHVAILYSILLVLECICLPETLYPRHAEPLGRRASTASGAERAHVYSDVKRTKELGYLSFRKIPGVSHPKPWDTILRFGKMWMYPTIVISVLTYVFCQYWWIAGILTMEPAAYANYSIQIQGIFFLGLIVGTVVAELLFSGRLSDRIVVIQARKNGGFRTPEMRLWLGYPAAILSSLGLFLWGLSVDRKWHWITGQVAFAFYGAGLQMGNTALSSYILDSYVDYSMDVITFYAVLINLSAFANPWYINTWVESSGYTWTFATQAIITTAGVCPVYFILQKYGSRWRREMSL